MISKEQYGFMGKSTKEVMLAGRLLMEKHREDQKELCCVSVDLVKTCDRMPREKL